MGPLTIAYFGGGDVDASDELEASLAAHWQGAREHWAGVSVEVTTFARYLGERTRVDGAPRLDRFHTADLYLACACARGDARALGIFDEQFLAHTAKYVARVSRDELFVDEVRQELREKLFVARPLDAPRIASFTGRGPLAGWVRMAAMRTALNRVRGQAASREVVDVDPSLPQRLPGIEDESQKAFADALEHAMSQLSLDARTLLRLHYLDGLSFEQLSRVVGVPRSTLARRMQKIRAELLGSTRARLGDVLRLGSKSVDSLIRLAVSRIDLSVERILKQS